MVYSLFVLMTDLASLYNFSREPTIYRLQSLELATMAFKSVHSGQIETNLSQHYLGSELLKVNITLLDSE